MNNYSYTHAQGACEYERATGMTFSAPNSSAKMDLFTKTGGGAHCIEAVFATYFVEFKNGRYEHQPAVGFDAGRLYMGESDETGCLVDHEAPGAVWNDIAVQDPESYSVMVCPVSDPKNNRNSSVVKVGLGTDGEYLEYHYDGSPLRCS